MISYALEIFLWLIVSIVVFLVINNYVGLKRFGSAILSLLISSIVVAFIYNCDLISEVLFDGSLILLALFGLTAIFRAVRSDFDSLFHKKST